jgi:hypothetical protein
MALQALSAITLVASLVVLPPLAIHRLVDESAPFAAWPGRSDIPVLLSLLPQLAGLFGLLAGLASLLAWHNSVTQVGTVAVPPPVLEGADSPHDGMPAIVKALGILLADQRQEMAAVQEACSTATRDAMIVGARLAGVALDAETRLAVSVAEAERSLAVPHESVTYIAGIMLRLEHSLPAFAELIDRSLANQLEIAETVAHRDAAAAAFAATAAEMAAQIAAVGDIAATWQYDAAQLKTAAREVATAGASVVSRAAETLLRVESAVTGWPEIATSISQATDRTATSTAEMSDLLASIKTELDVSVRDIRQCAAAGQRDSETVQTLAMRLISKSEEAAQQLTDAAVQMDRSLIHVPQLRDDLVEAAARLRRDAETSQTALLDATTATHRALAEGSLLLASELQVQQAAHAAIALAATELHREADGIRAAGTGIGDASERLCTRLLTVACDISRHLNDVTVDVTYARGNAAPDAGRLHDPMVEIVERQHSVLRDLEMQVDRLMHTTGWDDARHGLLSSLTDQLTAASARVNAAAESCSEKIVQQIAPELARLGELGERIAGWIVGVPSITVSVSDVEQIGQIIADGNLAHLRDLSAEITHAVHRLEAASANHVAANDGMATSAAMVAAAVEAVRDAQLLAAGPTLSGGPTQLSQTLRYIGTVEREADLLLRETESLAEAVLSGASPEIPDMLTARTPCLLAGLDLTINRLRSSATALALASDGAVALQARRQGS